MPANALVFPSEMHQSAVPVAIEAGERQKATSLFPVEQVHHTLVAHVGGKSWI
jgi:hypothetical protein